MLESWNSPNSVFSFLGLCTNPLLWTVIAKWDRHQLIDLQRPCTRLIYTLEKMDVFGLRLSVLMFIENTSARTTNEHAIVWSIWKMGTVELEALFRAHVRAAKTALSGLYLLALKLIRNIVASIINALVHKNLWACSDSIFWNGKLWVHS